jgi:hypothetical protein
MMDNACKEKMFSLMMGMCCKGMPEEVKSKIKEQMQKCCRDMASMMSQLKDMCQGMPERFKSCCGKTDFSQYMKVCFVGEDNEKSKA